MKVFTLGWLADGTRVCFIRQTPRGRWIVSDRRKLREIKPEWWRTTRP